MIKILEKYRIEFTEYLSMPILIAGVLFDVIGKGFVNILNINKTMGWKWSVLHTWIDNIPFVTLLIFFASYLIFNLLKIKTNLQLSVFHFFTVALSSFLYNFWELDLRFILFVIGFSFIIFVANIYDSLKNRLKTT